MKLGKDGTILAQWGERGGGAGEVDSSSDLAVDSEGNVYVIDTYNHRVQKFSPAGKFLLQWGRQEKVHNVRSALNFLWDEDLEGGFYFYVLEAQRAVRAGLDQKKSIGAMRPYLRSNSFSF